LVAISGKKLPTTFDHEGATIEVRAGAFTITADGKCRSKIVMVPPDGKERTVEVMATYTLEGPKLNVLNMQWEGAGMTSGTVEGNSFTMENEGMVYSYRK
jgi:hypothetical protein